MLARDGCQEKTSKAPSTPSRAVILGILLEPMQCSAASPSSAQPQTHSPAAHLSAVLRAGLAQEHRSYCLQSIADWYPSPLPTHPQILHALPPDAVKHRPALTVR